MVCHLDLSRGQLAGAAFAALMFRLLNPQGSAHPPTVTMPPHPGWRSQQSEQPRGLAFRHSEVEYRKVKSYRE